MQLLKLKGKLIAAALFLLVALLIMILMGAAVLSAIVGGNAAQSTTLAGCHEAFNSGGNTSADDPKAPADVAKGQDQIVKDIEKAVKEEGIDGKAVRIVAIAGYGESTLTNIGYGDQDTSGTTNPDGSAATSFGFLQQQTSMGWGSKKDVMDPVTATKSFLTGRGGNKGLLDVPGWENMEPTQAIHAVQNNADASHYVQFYEPADQVLKRANISTDFSGKTSKDGQNGTGNDSGKTEPGKDGPSHCGTEATGNVKGTDPKNTYPWDDKTSGMTPDPMSFYYGECTSYAGYKINEQLGVKPSDPMIFTNKIAGNGNTWGKAWEANGWKVSQTPVPGSVAWWDSNSAPGIGQTGHVAWVEDVKDGKAVIDEYNNSYYGHGAHHYSTRPAPIGKDDPEAPSGYLVVPTKDQINHAGPKVG